MRKKISKERKEKKALKAAMSLAAQEAHDNAVLERAGLDHHMEQATAPGDSV